MSVYNIVENNIKYAEILHCKKTVTAGYNNLINDNIMLRLYYEIIFNDDQTNGVLCVQEI